MSTHRYAITETVTYHVSVELDDGMDPESEEATTLAEETFCGLEDRDEHFMSVDERSVELVVGPPRLDNGAVLLAYHWIDREPRNGKLAGGIALAKTDGVQPYVTWEFGRLTKEHPASCTAGHYFARHAEAEADYQQRVRRGY